MEILSTKRIQQLPDHLANQIAAGEVIERPASVLKELLENSLDAGSTCIEVTIERSGVGLIRVQDNGVGICKEDLSLALASHATSKIESLSDLEKVLSYGFRGEALSSISAISRLSLSSAVSEQEWGWRLEVEGRTGTPYLTPVPKRLGTIIEVRDLFYNTPARRKFLRSEKTEIAYLEDMFKKIALSQPNVTFVLYYGNRLQKRLPACQTLEAHTRRIAMVCGEPFVKEAYYVQAEANGFILKGWLGSPHHLRSQADLQYFYVNQRIVRDKVVMHAVRKAYQEAVETVLGRYPAYVLYFELDPASVDVNVHPTKHEVRFREARTVHAFLSYAIQESLKQGKRAPVSTFENNDFVKKPSLSSNLTFTEFNKTDVKEPTLQEPLVADSIGRCFLLKGELLWVENEEGVIGIDIQGARALLFLQQLQAAYQQEGVSKRLLLLPKSIVLTQQGMQKFKSTSIQWEKLGFEITEIGINIVLIRSVPVELMKNVDNTTEFFTQLLILDSVEDCIKFITDFVITSKTYSEEEAKQWLIEMQASKAFQNNPRLQKFYRSFSMEALKKALLFS